MSISSVVIDFAAECPVTNAHALRPLLRAFFFVPRPLQLAAHHSPCLEFRATRGGIAQPRAFQLSEFI